MGMIAKPIAGWIADYFSKQKAVFLISIILTGVGYFSLQLVSRLEADNSSQLLCSNPQSILKVGIHIIPVRWSEKLQITF